MVDFRYHLVSIIAVFLALAVGIVVGTAALNGPVIDGLRGSIDRLSDDKRTLEGDVRSAQEQVTASDDFATVVGPELVDEALVDQRVLLVTVPGTPDDLAERLRPVLAQAGATVTGELELLPALGDQQSRPVIEDLVASVLPAGVDLPGGEPVEQAAAVLAASLTTGGGAPGVDAAEAQAVVSAFTEADLVRFDGEGSTLQSATTVVVLTPPGPERDATTEEQAAAEVVLTVVGALDERARGAVVAGPSTAALDGGLVRALRETVAA